MKLCINGLGGGEGGGGCFYFFSLGSFIGAEGKTGRF